MTLKKLGLSLVAASVLTTSAFSASNLADANVTTTFNTHYTNSVAMVGDENATVGVDYNATEAGIPDSAYIRLVLTGDVAFPGTDDSTDAGKWTFVNDSASVVATGAQFENSGSDLLMTVTTAVNVDDNLSLMYDGNANTIFFVKDGADTNGTLTIKGQDSNFINLANTTATVTIAGVTNTANLVADSGTITCAEAIAIDTDNRSQYDGNGDEDNVTSFSCDLNTTAISTASMIDYDYTDVDYTVTFTASNSAILSDGNFTNANVASDAIASSVQTMVLEAEDATSAVNEEFVYQVSTSNDLTAGTITEAVSGSANTVSADVATDDTTTISLNTFSATVKFMRSGTGVDTSIRLFNSSATDAAYTMTITDKDGVNVGEVTTTDVVPANGASNVSASEIKALVLTQKSVTLGNGFNVTVNYTDVAKGDGDASATQQDSSGKYGVRVTHNNPHTDTTNYQGL